MRNHMDANYHFGEVKMWNDGNRKQQVGVLVEAKADKKFFDKHFREGTAFFCCGGWKIAIETIQKINQSDLEGVLAIIDADFRRITNEMPEDENLFLTDFHDNEMMLINSKAWDNVILFFADTSLEKDTTISKLKKFEQTKQTRIKAVLLNLALQIAYLRLYNHQEEAGLRFRIQRKNRYNYIDYSKFVSKQTLELEFEKLKKEVENKSNKADFFKNEEVLEKLSKIRNQEYDLLEICNGHDVINLLSFALEKAIANKSSGSKVQPTEIEQSLIMAYRFEDFQQTNLYQSLKNWEENYHSYKLFN